MKANDECFKLLIDKLLSIEACLGSGLSGGAKYISISDGARRYGLSRTKLYELIKRADSPKVFVVDGKRLMPIFEWDEYIERFALKK